MTMRTIDTTEFGHGILSTEVTEQHWLGSEQVQLRKKIVTVDFAALWQWIESDVYPRMVREIRQDLLDDVRKLAPEHAEAVATVLAAKETEGALRG